MNDNPIDLKALRKALDICTSNEIGVCAECPYRDDPDCAGTLVEHANLVIKALDAELEKVRSEHE